ncbi:hypothetical protein ACW5R3_11045 [Bizionia sp. KMM 8389]
MKNGMPSLLLMAFGLFFNFSSGQAKYIAKLEQNKNVEARSLVHELNKTKDTLLLKSDSKITRVYSLNDEFEREIDLQIDTYNYKMPLNKLPKGKHVLVVSQSPKKIIFVIYILDKTTKIEHT